ncbi:MAG: hypothetical protein FWH32_03715 [Clostridiales bacterium]|nr:hypothetical protein [Clostridiales bacterium]
MKKIALALAFVLLVCILSACGSSANYESLKTLDNGAKLEWGERTYSFYSAKPNAVQIGKQVAIVDDDRKHKIFEVEGYSHEEWIVEYYDVIMSTYSLYKADGVTDVPAPFQQP